MIHKISFENYKVFEKKQDLELRPITILIGKNSSGKSALLRLVMMLQESLMPPKDIKKAPLAYKTKKYDIGSSFNDLIYQKRPRELKLSLKLDGEDGLDEIDISLRYYNEKQRAIIESYTTTTIPQNKLEDSHVQALTLKNIDPKPEYSYSINGKEVTLNKFEFRGLSYDLQYQNENRIIKQYPNIFFLPQINYQPPLRPNLKPIYHPIEDDDSTAQLLFQNEDLLNRVSEWYRDNLGVGIINVNTLLESGHFSLNMLANKGFNIRLMDVGQGIGQSLPIVTHALAYSENTIHILEQPELHLHPAAHGEIAELIAKSIKKTNNSKFLIETHSENFILRLRSLILRKDIDFSIDDIIIYSVEYDNEEESSILKEINVDDMAEVDYWPKGVFSESFEEIREIRNLQREKKEKI